MPLDPGRSIEVRVGMRVAVRHPSLTTYGLLDDLDKGQVFELQGERLDQKLVDLGYVLVLAKKDKPVQCGVCGKDFLSEQARHAHGELRHQDRFGRRYGAMQPLMPAMLPGCESTADSPLIGAAFLDTEGDAESDRAAQDTPLFLENTTASRH